MKQTSLYLTLGSVMLLAACQTVPYQGEARNVKRKPQENGVIALKENYRPEDRQKADEYMKSNCAPYPFKVSEEGEAVIGQATTSNERQNNRKSTETQVGALFGIPLMSGDQGGKDTQSSSTVTQLREWQIQYNCEKSVANANSKSTKK